MELIYFIVIVVIGLVGWGIFVTKYLAPRHLAKTKKQLEDRTYPDYVEPYSNKELTEAKTYLDRIKKQGGPKQ